MIQSANGNGKSDGGIKTDPIMDRMLNLDAAFFAARKSREMEINSSYGSGEASRLNPIPRGVNPLGENADSHFKSDYSYYLHVERGRVAVRNHPLVEQGINRLIANLRLDGFSLDVDSGDPSLDADQKADWKMWAGETMAGQSLCDYEGTRTFQQIARQSFFSRVSEGDCLHVPLTDGKIQTWESHHIRSPHGNRSISSHDQNGIVQGAEVVNGKTVAYWVTPFSLRFNQSLARTGMARRFPVLDEAGNKITFWNGFRHRFFQRRGVSRLSAPRDAMTGFDDLNYANIKSSLRRALIAYLMEDSPTKPASLAPLGKGGALPTTGDRYAKSVGLGLETVVVEQQGEPAQVFRVPDGKTMTGWHANIPGESFFEHSSLLLTMLSVNLDIPIMFLLLDGSLVNFHGGRMIFDQVKLKFQQIQKDEIQGLWGPTYEWRTRLRATPGHALYDPKLAAAIKGGFNPFAYVFRPRGWPYVKPAEDVAAETSAIKGRVKSERSVLSERGVDLDEHRTEVISDEASWIRISMAVAFKMATEFKAKYKIEIDVEAYAAKLRKDEAWKQDVITDMAAEQNRQAQTEAAASAN